LPYLVVYRMKNEAIEIARIFHAAQDWPQIESEPEEIRKEGLSLA